MVKKLLILYFLTSFINPIILGQKEIFSVELAPFSSNRYDEFSPVYYKNGIVFCTNRKSGSFTDYSTSLGKGTFKINYIDTTHKKVTWRKAELFSKSLRTHFNDGPATFDSDYDTIYFSRNVRTQGKLRELSTSQNKLGIFSAVLSGKKWGDITELRFNNELYNMTAPYVSPDGLNLFFASDRPGGYGGSDVYYSYWSNGYWQDPVNLGSSINTAGNESFPFLNEAGELFFSSDGHAGLGGKDIFVTKQQTSGWYTPIMLDTPINSEYDDISIVTNPLMNDGYFSSKRGKTIDIYHFKSDFPHFWFSEPQKDNQFCFMISDTGSIKADTVRFQYIWDFGDNVKIPGISVSHCFPGPGNYIINLDIIDRRSGKLFFRMLTYEVEIFNIEQPFISSPDVCVANDTIELNGLKSFCPGYSIEGYFWNFGDGKYTTGEIVKHNFIESGDFDIRLGLILKSQKTGAIIKRAVSKKIKVVQEEQERTSYLTDSTVTNQAINDIRRIENMRVREQFSAEAGLNKESLFQVILLSSPSRLTLTNQFFRKVPPDYIVKENFDAKSGLYSYSVDQQMSLMATYPAYSEMIALGYSNTVVRIYELNEPAEKELYNIRKNYSLLTDINFDANNILSTNAYIMLDQVVNLMNKYPGIKLEIGVHTDNLGIQSSNMSSSQLRAQIIVNYLINRGISSKRLSANGYGSKRPITLSTYPSDRRLNRRIDFIILGK
jgi:outer membrane protein OmpA-like peptidoglycan-associated protein